MLLTSWSLELFKPRIGLSVAVKHEGHDTFEFSTAQRLFLPRREGIFAARLWEGKVWGLRYSTACVDDGGGGDDDDDVVVTWCQVVRSKAMISGNSTPLQWKDRHLVKPRARCGIHPHMPFPMRS